MSSEDDLQCKLRNGYCYTILFTGKFHAKYFKRHNNMILVIKCESDEKYQVRVQEDIAELKIKQIQLNSVTGYITLALNQP